jgi:hypothetical protein
MSNSNRRQFLKNTGGLALGLLGVGLTGGAISCAKSSSAETTGSSPTSSTTIAVANMPTPTILPWPYQKLDPAGVADRAYTLYNSSGCMMGAFESMVGALRDKIGAPYTSFPTAMMRYGSVGVAGWGTLCGALNGAAALSYLVMDTTRANQIINELFYWYGATSLPDYTPANPKITNLPASVANSQLCHESITNWCLKSGFKTDSAQRSERCARLTASVVRQTVDLLNQQAAGTFKAAYKMPDAVSSCLSCHGSGHALSDVHITNQTSCLSCHPGLDGSHWTTTTK